MSETNGSKVKVTRVILTPEDIHEIERRNQHKNDEDIKRLIRHIRMAWHLSHDQSAKAVK